MEYFTYFTNGASFPYTDPSVAAQYYNYMNGLWANGTTGSVPTNYIFPGNPNLPYQWSESDTMSSHSSGDRRGVMT